MIIMNQIATKNQIIIKTLKTRVKAQTNLLTRPLKTEAIFQTPRRAGYSSSYKRPREKERKKGIQRRLRKLRNSKTRGSIKLSDVKARLLSGTNLQKKLKIPRTVRKSRILK